MPPAHAVLLRHRTLHSQVFVQVHNTMLNPQARVSQVQDKAGAAPAAAPVAGALRPEAPASADSVDAVQTAAAAPAAPPVAEAGAALALRRAQTDAHRTLAIQVCSHCARQEAVVLARCWWISGCIGLPDALQGLWL